MEMKIVRKSSRNNNVIPASEVIGHVFKAEDISKIKLARINWNERPESVTDIEDGVYGECRNNHMDVALDDINERVITLSTEKFKKNYIKSVVINGDTGQLSATYLDGTVATIDMFGYTEDDCKNRTKSPQSIFHEVYLRRINWDDCPENIAPV